MKFSNLVSESLTKSGKMSLSLLVEEEEKNLSEDEQWRRYWRQRELDRIRRQRSLPAGHDLPVLNSSHVAFSNSLRGGR